MTCALKLTQSFKIEYILPTWYFFKLNIDEMLKKKSEEINAHQNNGTIFRKQWLKTQSNIISAEKHRALCFYNWGILYWIIYNKFIYYLRRLNFNNNNNNKKLRICAGLLEAFKPTCKIKPHKYLCMTRIKIKRTNEMEFFADII